jgi:hypothetical protein
LEIALVAAAAAAVSVGVCVVSTLHAAGGVISGRWYRGPRLQETSNVIARMTATDEDGF